MNRHKSEASQRSEAISILINQIMFFALCDRWFCPKERVTGLYALLFYNVLIYLFVYTQRLIYLHEECTLSVYVSENSNVRHLAKSVTKIMLEFTRAVTFVVTGVFMLLMFGLEQGLEHFHPTWYYLLITVTYFSLTERLCQDKAPELLSWLEWDFFESMEPLWSPVLLRLSASIASGLMISLVFFTCEDEWALLLAASFVNVYLGMKDLEQHWQILMKEKQSMSKYRYATWKELSDFNDVCAVCLQMMTCARVTPCNHMFHGYCLRRCLKERPSCPICKQDLEDE